jgi:hypothetical protein
MVSVLPFLKFEERAKNIYAGTAAYKILALYFVPPHLTGAVDHNLQQSVLADLLQNVDPFMTHACWCSTTLFLQFDNS